jgi:hypothetical protein
MSGSEHKRCYGTMFPSTLELDDKLVRGKVFAYQLLANGGLYRSARRVTHDLTEWDDCLKCPEFEHCYKLCLAQLMLETAISEK